MIWKKKKKQKTQVLRAKLTDKKKRVFLFHIANLNTTQLISKSSNSNIIMHNQPVIQYSQSRRPAP